MLATAFAMKQRKAIIIINFQERHFKSLVKRVGFYGLRNTGGCSTWDMGNNKYAVSSVPSKQCVAFHLKLEI